MQVERDEMTLSEVSDRRLQLAKELRWEAYRLPNKFSANDELFQLLIDAANEIEKAQEELREYHKYDTFLWSHGVFRDKAEVI